MGASAYSRPLRATETHKQDGGIDDDVGLYQRHEHQSRYKRKTHQDDQCRYGHHNRCDWAEHRNTGRQHLP
jgi:hypothetical protein